MEAARRYFGREISWLQFSERVLQGAEDPTVPLIERIRFLGILQITWTVFRVRYSSIRRFALAENQGFNEDLEGYKPSKLLKKLSEIVTYRQQEPGNL